MHTPTNVATTDHLSEQEKAGNERRKVAEDERIVDEEFQLYEAKGILDEANPKSGDFDLIRYWEVSVWSSMATSVSGLMYYQCRPQLFPESVFFPPVRRRTRCAAAVSRPERLRCSESSNLSIAKTGSALRLLDCYRG
jgi:hypothetical protein